MSNWGQPYFGNQNFCNRPNVPEQNWDYYRPGVHPRHLNLFPQNRSREFYNSPEYYNTGHAASGPPVGMHGVDFPSTSSSNSQTFCNSSLNNEIWAKAANSNLVPTAGEFIPSATYHPTNNFDTQGGTGSGESCSNGSSNGPYQHSSGKPYNGNSKRGDSFQYGKSRGQGSGYQNHRSNYQHHYSHQQSQHHNNNYYHPNNSRESNQKYGKNWDQNRNGDRHVWYGRSYDQHSGAGACSSSSEDTRTEGRRKPSEEAGKFVNFSSSNEDSSQTSSNLQDEESKYGRNFNSDNKGMLMEYKNSHSYRSDKGNRDNGDSDSGKYFANRKNNHMPSGAKKQQFNRDDDAVSQREHLTDQLNRGTLECLVCYDKIRQNDQVWSCSNCFHVLHLRCTIKWANSSNVEKKGWRCPACQNVSQEIPRNYICFCGKLNNPEWNRVDNAHSCGEVCNKLKPSPTKFFECQHRCTLLCHPGPCPPCVTLTQRKCGCGRTSQMFQCGHISPTLSCGAKCEKLLNCGIHVCEALCHLGDCDLCRVKIEQECYCGSKKREVPCDGKNSVELNFRCDGLCPKKIKCGQHQCLEPCHPGDCKPCPLDPATVTHCPCGKTPLASDVERKSCFDPVPTCNQICGKKLKCGPPVDRHTCKSFCHEGPCPACDLSTFVPCRCGNMDLEIKCKDMAVTGSDVRCQKKCSKKRTCGKHKCNQMCCVELDHICPWPCPKTLTCGQHRCEDLCHKGHCKPCWRTSFEELYCECGSSVIYPPVACGTKPPECNKPCSRQHSCDHPTLHTCHSELTCPPCSILTAKYCHGKHELRKTVPCHLEEFSCGLPCGKELPCGRHKCIMPCHKGDCLKPGKFCVQPCTKARSLCGHPCNAPCHEDACPDTLCKENVKVTCECGNRSLTRTCCENNKEYQRIATSLLASKMADVQLGRSIDLGDMQGARKMSLKTLECNDECRIIERSRRMCIGLQIRNPDLSMKLTPRYSDFMRNWGKKNAKFCQFVHDKLTELVKLAKESKQKSRSYSFETMNKEKRQFVHEYCEHFGCESVSYDAEPKRNVVATAQRDKAWLPSYSLLEVMQREMGQRKVPVPTLSANKKPPTRTASSQSVRLPQSQVLMSSMLSSSSSATKQPQQSQPVTNQIDYFDYTN